MYQCTQEVLLKVLLGTSASAVLVHTPPSPPGQLLLMLGPNPSALPSSWT